MAQYGDRPKGALGGFVGAEGASWIVYLAVMAAWLYVAGEGNDFWADNPPEALIVLFAIALITKFIAWPAIAAIANADGTKASSSE